MQLLDIAVLVLMMVAVSVYGIWKSRSAAKSDSVKEFIVGSDASVLSVALSVCSGFISSISLLGFPGEVFYNGAMILWYIPMYFISFPLVAYVFLPVHYGLKLTSIYEYFELRFNRGCRAITAFLFVLEIILYNAVALYAPSVAIGALLELPIPLSIVMTAAISALYICVGGARSGIHTSAVQMVLIFVCMALIAGLSLRDTQLSTVIERIQVGGRLRLDETRVDPLLRHSIPSLLLGGTGTILSLFAANQMSLQKYLSMRTLKQAQRVVLTNIPCNILIMVVYVSTGFLIFSVYYDCTPKIATRNELLPYFVLDKLSVYPGLTGLFAVAVYNAGISTLSATFSSGNAVILEDVVRPVFQLATGTRLPDHIASKAIRILPIVFALVAVGLALLCAKLDSLVLQLAFSIFGVVGGPVLGGFILGFFFPFIRGRAAFVAILAATFSSFYIAIGAFSRKIGAIALPVNTQCSNVSDFSYSLADESLRNAVTDISGSTWEQIFRISYQYYSVVGVVVCLVVGLLAQIILSLIGFSDGKEAVKRSLLSPLFARPAATTIEIQGTKEVFIKETGTV